MTIWETIFASITATTTAAAVMGSTKSLAPRVKRGWTQRRLDRSATMTARREAREREAEERAMREKIAAAEEQGKAVALYVTDDHPRARVFSDGSCSYHFCGDHEGYRAALQSGQYDPRRTYPGFPPPVT
ncbi:hypothetical protein IU449_27775 [Nocardia higoensis]|uniref:Uncharacterized protein n=1 Tax=Nocardia higoensis TaxID=228599 RepID=A0ABS0DIM6_9NOCA|nr:hypothetical protein [Nocardia higoensis]MBF6358302.1 hypothetical protein [Nocardia higoensis]